ncbi:MAG: NUDIX domain-containing protein [Austwickia sp.]|nr:NUDIX domain-containing protein [Austwickia sp.]MBK9101684.1 NUDIX domain-containing protein [Austwickia sp.]
MEQTRRRHHVDVVAAALVDDLSQPTRILAGRRRDRPPGQGWELPGGKLEPGETMHGALHRELAEELGVTVALGAQLAGPLPDGRWRLSRRHVMGVWFARVTSGEPAALEAHDELRWLRRHELRDVVWLAGDYPIVDALSAVLRDAP